ncbi:hypothetical protein [Pseudooctadecabacter sp.]|uniref:hypothetical protein n=1 Tax=Pseudooctadecabacter sp. TaxID=1966338 RepID=UPI0035C7C872
MEDKDLYEGQTLIATMTEVETDTEIARFEYRLVAAPAGADAPEGMPALTPELISESWITPEAKALNAPPEGGVESKADTALEVTKFAWYFIKDNKPVSDAKDTTTSIILKDTDPLDYQMAKDTQSSTIQLKIHDSLFKDWILVDTKARLEGTYHATPSKDDMAFGHYIPALHFNVTNIKVDWPISLNAHAEVSPPSNKGPKDNVQPQVKLTAKFKVHWLFQTMTFSAGFTANGLTGFRFNGWN